MKPVFLIPLLVWMGSLATARQCWGQAAWEYTPYQARIWVALAPVPALPSALVEKFREHAPARAAAVFGSFLEVDLVQAPRAVTGELLKNLDSLTADQVVAAASEADLAADKIYLTAITFSAAQFQVRCREFDCRTRQLGPPSESTCATSGALSLALWDGVRACFTPLARIEQVTPQSIVARLRAGGLISGDSSPALVQPDMVLRPILRRNDRHGQPVTGGIQPIGWTYLTVQERHGAVIECVQRSGYAAAIPARGSPRLERLALLIKPTHSSTELVLRSRTEVAKPLVGYEVHRRQGNSNQTERVGVTDHQGALQLPGQPGALESYLVKSGKQLLARLPVVLGAEKQLTAFIVDDDPRLAAEGYLAALSSRALDLVARREILAARIRSRLQTGQPKEAQQLLDEFRRLPSRTELSRDLDRQRQQWSSADKATQLRIVQLFSDGQRLLLVKPLSDDLLAQLTREVAAATSAAEKDNQASDPHPATPEPSPLASEP